MDRILCIETGTDICSVALSTDGTLLSLRESSEGRSHAQNLAVYVDEILRENDLTCSDLSAVAISMGPGSYTGLRIGSSLAKGMCYAENIPLIAISTLQALTVGALADFEAGLLKSETLENRILAPMIDARRMEVYTQLFTEKAESLTTVTAEVVTENSFTDFRDHDFIIFGDGAKKCADILSVRSVILENIAPSARNMTKLAYDKFLKKEFADIAYFEPLYLKDFIGTTKKKNPFEIPVQRRKRL
ncbi:MAG: tRNA (adenosine(37)-N6)-threonylcarbamoyltransferase complex dimerization subunit type 1 TsaB [Rikenellaceae bacterium]